ncbi:hypothetical protein SBRCBS47491_008711 [Sporothrix bragantina]|uniref:Metallo-beta-lactamase domain-containing protein n=1 Tax=Sporothrix bragantina TaxID=671064 RepID=A0ABP0CQ67_9PEZI
MAGLGVPISNATARVRMVDTTGVMLVKSAPFIQPVQKGHETLSLYVAAFLIDHPPSGRKIMFDLGVRKDYWTLPASLQKRLGTVIPGLRIDKDTTEILQEQGIALNDISSVVWSHYHWDHTGSMELFPSSTELVVGSGFKGSPSLLPGYPANPDSPIDARALAGRTLTEIDFAKTSLEIAGFRAHDFFGDGSFYLLDTPGHCLGHVCGLVRTTGGTKSTFVLLGGDICHFPGVTRPSPQLPLPDVIPKGILRGNGAYFPSPCPCSLFTDHHPAIVSGGDADRNGLDPRTAPFYAISNDPSSAYMDPEVAQQSVDKLIFLDASPSVLVCLAHDETMLHSLPTLNENPDDDLNRWQERDLKSKIHWGWLNDLARDGRPAWQAAVEGFWRDGQLWAEGKATLLKNGEAASTICL